jgi:FixJ family two-component response regulator
MNGLQLQRLLASRFHQIPIIFVSAYGSDQEERAAMEAGAVDFLRKPFNEQALGSAVQKALLRAAHAQ